MMGCVCMQMTVCWHLLHDDLYLDANDDLLAVQMEKLRF